VGIPQSITSASDAPFAHTPSLASARSDADALEAALADMTATFSTDSANGRPGMAHDTDAHRARVLREMAGRLAAMRGSNPPVEA
jgi:hypothetical protein